MARTLYVIGIGSNRRHGRYGSPHAVITAAALALNGDGLLLLGATVAIETAALGPAGRRFANAAALIESALPPPALLALLNKIEARFGRRRGRRWGARVLDLDILLWSGGRWRGKVHDRGLTIPHRGLWARNFALGPAAELVSGWRDPETGWTMAHRLARLRKRRPIDDTPART